MSRAYVLLVLALVLVLPAGAFEIVEFCPDPYLHDDPDEYFVLEGTGSLDGVTVTDGEGSVRFPAGAVSSGRVTVARDAAAYRQVHGLPPDYEIAGADPAVPEMVSAGNLRMANKQDSLALMTDRAVVQEVRWPEDVAAREGQVHFLRDGVWDPHPRMIGQSDFGPATYENVTVTLFVSPDCSYRVFSDAIGSARRRIDANVYEFTHPGIAGMLADAAGRGVEVSVLLEGGPVGGISAEEENVASYLTENGVSVAVMTTQGDVHARYRFDHAKYLVIDGESVLVVSENFKESGIPETGQTGNRGWGAWVRDPRVAGYFSAVYDADSTGGDIGPAPTGGAPAATGQKAYDAVFEPLTVEGAAVTPVLSPETSDLITALIAGAEERVLIEQAYITNSTGGAPNRFLAEAIDAARRGVAVRVILDSSWFNVEGDDDNDEQAAWINALARSEALPLEARCVDLDAANLEKVHTKGVVVDNRSVLVSSINWNDNSPDFNREAGVIVDHPDAARYFAAAFDADWNAGDQAGNESDVRIVCAATIVLIFALIYAVRKIRR
ncbi:MAG: hypothetical protein PWP08_513 [Methanofollis sp.]|nr:hypothetical protein [Methanofollis sp.]